MADTREFLFANNATCRLAAAVAPSDTAIALEIGKGALFPSPVAGQIAKLTLQNVLTGAYEIVNITSRSGDSIQVERAVESTIAGTWATATTVVQNRITRETLEKLQESGAGGGGGGGSASAPYLTYTGSSDLSADKVLQAEAGVLLLIDEIGAMRMTVVDNGITDTKFRQSAGLSVVGRSVGTTGNVADIAAGSDGDVLRRSGSTLGFGSIPQSSVTGLVTALSTLSNDIAVGDAGVLAVVNTKVSPTRTIATQHSLTGGGDLSTNRTLSLVGDMAAPGNNMFYGTNGSGTRGWYAVSTGVTDHGVLTGLTDDDHTQYHNNARGDARYPLLTRSIATQYSLTGGGDLSSNRTLTLTGDVAAPGNNMFYGTDGTGTRGWFAVATGVTDHGALTGLTDDDHTQYLNNTRGDARYPPLARSVATQHSLTGGGDLTANRTLSLVGDTAAPGNNMFYGTNGSGTRGWYASPTAGVTSLTGTTNQVTVSASTGAVTLSLPQNIHSGANPQFNSLGVGTAGAGTAGLIRATNDVVAFYSSDARLKENVERIADPLQRVRKLRGVRFDWTEEHIREHGGLHDYFMRKHDVGVIAQEVEAVLPEVVATRPDGIKAVRYDRLVALLIEAVKELDARWTV